MWESPGGAAAEAVKPKDRFQTPLIGRLEITEGKITYQDPKRKLVARRHDLDRDRARRAPSRRPS